MRKILLPMVTLLVLSVMLIAPTMAKTEVPYSSHIESALVDPGKQWVTEGGILHIRDSHWVGKEVGTLGDGILDDWLSFNINVATGEGTFSAHWLLTYKGRHNFGERKRHILNGILTQWNVHWHTRHRRVRACTEKGLAKRKASRSNAHRDRRSRHSILSIETRSIKYN